MNGVWGLRFNVVNFYHEDRHDWHGPRNRRHLIRNEDREQDGQEIHDTQHERRRDHASCEMNWKQDQTVGALPMDVRGELEDTPTAVHM